MRWPAWLRLLAGSPLCCRSRLPPCWPPRWALPSGSCRMRFRAGFSITGAVLALAGLFSIFAFMAGLVRFDRQNQTRTFFDGLTDAIGDACVVTDGKSRAIYGNAPFLKLTAAAGVGRLVGFDLLYAGQAAFVEPIYQLSQAALEGKSDSREIRLPAGSTAAGASPDAPKWLKISVAPLAGQGKRGLVLWRLQDVSVDRARQEKAFGRLQFIITYLDHAPAGFFSSLPNQKIDYLNATLAEWLGLDIAESQNGELQPQRCSGRNRGQASHRHRALGRRRADRAVQP